MFCYLFVVIPARALVLSELFVVAVAVAVVVVLLTQSLVLHWCQKY
jgi:hypothetical protein